MRKAGFLLAIASLLLLPLAVAAQDGGNIARAIYFRAKPGMEKQLEEGAKKHMQWHRQQGDPWEWHVFQAVSGDETGMYIAVTFGHNWADFDTSPVPSEADEADAEVNIVPYVGRSVVRHYAFLADVSKPLEGGGFTPLTQVISFHVRPGKQADFNYLVGKFHEAIGKTDWPVNYAWYALVDGGPGGTYLLALPRENWAAFAQPEKPFPAMLEEAYGRQEAQSLLKKWGKILKGTESRTSRHRDDLSYIPSSE